MVGWHEVKRIVAARSANLSMPVVYRFSLTHAQSGPLPPEISLSCNNHPHPNPHEAHNRHKSQKRKSKWEDRNILGVRITDFYSHTRQIHDGKDYEDDKTGELCEEG